MRHHSINIIKRVKETHKRKPDSCCYNHQVYLPCVRVALNKACLKQMCVCYVRSRYRGRLYINVCIHAGAQPGETRSLWRLMSVFFFSFRRVRPHPGSKHLPTASLTRAPTTTHAMTLHPDTEHTNAAKCYTNAYRHHYANNTHMQGPPQLGPSHDHVVNNRSASG